MGALNEALGKGKKYTIDGVEYEVMPAVLEDLEDVGDLYNNKVYSNISANFMRFKDDNGKDEKKEIRDERISNLYKLLGKAFSGAVPKDKLKKLDIVEVKEIIDYFHRCVRA